MHRTPFGPTRAEGRHQRMGTAIVESMKRITTGALRAHLGEFVDRVKLRSDSFVIERRGVDVAALIPAERLLRIEDFARRKAQEMMALQDAHSRAVGADPAEAERVVAEEARKVRALRKRRERR